MHIVTPPEQFHRRIILLPLRPQKLKFFNGGLQRIELIEGK